MSETAPHENPLIKNEKLRQLYVAMVESRILADHVAHMQRRLKRSRRLATTRGQEACRVSTTLELDSGDLVSDTHDGATDLLLGIDIGTVLNRLSKEASDRIDRCTGSRQMPCMEHVNERLDMASGAALAFKTLNQPNLVLIYVRRGDAVGGSWKRILTRAAKLELPMIFVVLPDREGRKKRARVGHVSARAGSFGVPSIPVDASDAVALYRVAQESIGRVRGGGGPVVVECVALPTKSTFVDPIEQMKDFLLSRNVCTPAWLARAGDGLRDRIARSAKQSRAEE